MLCDECAGRVVSLALMPPYPAARTLAEYVEADLRDLFGAEPVALDLAFQGARGADGGAALPAVRRQHEVRLRSRMLAQQQDLAVAHGAQFDPGPVNTRRGDRDGLALFVGRQCGDGDVHG